MPHIIYLISNKLNGKVYVGQTSKSVEDRWKSHLKSCNRGIDTYFYNSVRKHGSDNFRLRELNRTDSPEVADKLEQYWISEVFQSYVPSNGYNGTLGGDGGQIPTKETKSKISVSAKLRWEDPEYRNKMSGIRKGLPSNNKGKKLSPEACLRMSLLKKGTLLGSANPFFGKTHSEEARAKMSKARLGVPQSEETRHKKSLAFSGKSHPLYNHNLSTEKIVELYRCGIKIQDIANQLGAPKRTIEGRLKNSGVERRRMAQ